MSTTNQKDSRSPANKNLSRYIHRIEQLVGHRGRSTSPLSSPISSRVGRPLKLRNLDQYLKYQFTFKILCGVFQKKNSQCSRHFFYSLRKSQQHKVEKVYKFVSIEKTECAHMTVDTGISTKMLVNVLRTQVKNNLRGAFRQLKSLLIFQPGVLNTARSNGSNIFPLTINIKIKAIMGVLFQKLLQSRVHNAWGKIYNCNSNKEVGKKSIIQIGNKIKIKLFTSILTMKMKQMQQSSFQVLKRYLLFAKQSQTQNYKFVKFVDTCWRLKKLTILKIIFASSHKYSKDLRASWSTNLIFNAINKISIVQISFITRIKRQFIGKLKINYNKNRHSAHCLMQIFKAKMDKKLLFSYYKIQNTKIALNKAEKEGSMKLNWLSIGKLVYIQRCFQSYLREPFEQIYLFSEKKKLVEFECLRICKVLEKIKLRYCLRKIKYKASNIISMSQKQQNCLVQYELHEKSSFLTRVLNKLLIMRFADAIIKLKYLKQKQITKPKTKISQWVSDITSFISQRDKFNKNLVDNYHKFQTLMTSSNRSDEKSSQDKYKGVISPKNKQIISELFSS